MNLNVSGLVISIISLFFPEDEAKLLFHPTPTYFAAIFYIYKEIVHLIFVRYQRESSWDGNPNK